MVRGACATPIAHGVGSYKKSHPLKVFPDFKGPDQQSRMSGPYPCGFQVYRLLRRLFFMSRKVGCSSSPMRRATVVARMSMMSRCKRRETMGLYLS